MKGKEDIKNIIIIIKEIKIKTIKEMIIGHIRGTTNTTIINKERKEETREARIITERITRMRAREEIKKVDSNNIEIITTKMETIEAVKEEDIKVEIRVIDSKLITKVKLLAHKITIIHRQSKVIKVVKVDLEEIIRIKEIEEKAIEVATIITIEVIEEDTGTIMIEVVNMIEMKDQIIMNQLPEEKGRIILEWIIEIDKIIDKIIDNKIIGKMIISKIIEVKDRDKIIEVEIDRIIEEATDNTITKEETDRNM